MANDSPSAPDNRTLLTAARAGDDSSLWRLSEELRPRLRAIAARRLGAMLAAKVDASDVVQNALTEAARAFPDFHGESIEEFEAWLVQIVKNEVHDVRRHWHQKKRSVGREQVKLDEPGKTGLDPSAGSSPSAAIMREEQAARIREFVDRLPADEAQVVRMKHLEGKSLADISEFICRSPDGTAGLLKRAMKRLRELMEGESV